MSDVRIPAVVESSGADPKGDIARLAERQDQAGNLFMRIVTAAGGQVEDTLGLLPQDTRAEIEAAARVALQQSYDIAAKSRTGAVGGAIGGDTVHRVLATISGAVGGVGGLSTALAELPVATTLIFRAVQDVAETHGEDPLSDATRIECLRVFGKGGPDADDDGIDTAFFGARVSLSGVAVNTLIARIAPRFAAVLSQKLATAAVPIIGAATGAGTNYAFMSQYTDLAHVHFGLRRLSRTHGEAFVTEEFHKALAARRLPGG